MNIAYRIRGISQQFPEKKSVILAKDGSFYSFKKFEERSNQIANRLVTLGIEPGMRTLLFVKPCLDFSLITFALFKIGAVPVLIDPGMGLKNLLTSVKQVRPHALISVGMVHWFRRIRPSFFTSIRVKISLQRVGGRTHYLYKYLEDSPTDFKIHEVGPEDYSAILFTSGGTGIPKGVVYTHGILNAQTEILQKIFSLDQNKIDLPGFPLFALFTLAMGMTSVIPEMDPTKPADCDPVKLVKNIQDNHITFIAGSPAIWERVGRYCFEKKIKLSTVKQVVMFGAPVRAEIHELFKNVLVDGDTYTPYGATECLPVTFISGSEILSKHLPKMLAGKGTCIGRPVPGMQVKIIEVTDYSISDVHEFGPGMIGEIAVQGPSVTSSYFEMPDETSKTKIFVDGKIWHRMGDLGLLDLDGNLWFFGRKVHRVETKNRAYYSIQVESIFNQHPEIKRTALVKLVSSDGIFPGLVIERFDKSTNMTDTFLKELIDLKESHVFTRDIKNFFLHKSFPVDVRHNIKIDRISLSSWAQNQMCKTVNAT